MVLYSEKNPIFIENPLEFKSDPGYSNVSGTLVAQLDMTKHIITGALPGQLSWGLMKHPEVAYLPQPVGGAAGDPRPLENGR
jgi:hypothetical protein